MKYIMEYIMKYIMEYCRAGLKIKGKRIGFRDNKAPKTGNRKS